MALGSSDTALMFSPCVFPHGLFPGLVFGSGKRQSVTPGYLLDAGSNTDKRVRLTKKTRPGDTFHSIPDQVHPTPRRWKRLRSPSSGVGREVGVPRNLFPRLGVG